MKPSSCDCAAASLNHYPQHPAFSSARLHALAGVVLSSIAAFPALSEQNFMRDIEGVWCAYQHGETSLVNSIEIYCEGGSHHIGGGSDDIGCSLSNVNPVFLSRKGEFSAKNAEIIAFTVKSKCSVVEVEQGALSEGLRLITVVRTQGQQIIQIASVDELYRGQYIRCNRN